MFGIPNEVVSIAGGAISSFLMAYMAARAKERAEVFEMALKAEDKSIESHDKAKARSNDAQGNKVRMLLVLFSLSAAVLIPFFMSLVGKSTFVEVQVEQPAAFFNIIPATMRTYFVEIPGALLTAEIRCALLYICGFYLGKDVSVPR